jgi:hypothetical protein
MAKKKHHHEEKRHEKKHEMHGMYEGHNERRHQEMKDAGMISEDKHAVANMPQHVVYRDWPRADRGLDSRLDDKISGIDRQMDEDLKGARRHCNPTKY